MVAFNLAEHHLERAQWLARVRIQRRARNVDFVAGFLTRELDLVFRAVGLQFKRVNALERRGLERIEQRLARRRIPNEPSISIGRG